MVEEKGNTEISRTISSQAFWEIRGLTDGLLLATLVSIPGEEELAQGVGRNLDQAIMDAKKRKFAEEKGEKYISAACIYNPRRDF